MSYGRRVAVVIEADMISYKLCILKVPVPFYEADTSRYAEPEAIFPV